MQNQAARRPRREDALEPLTVNHQTAQRLLQVGNTKYWTSLVKDGHIEVVMVGRRSMAKYSSVKRVAGVA